MRSLTSLSQRNLRRRLSRSLLTAGGTALGVAVLFAVLVTTGTATRALDRALAAQAGKADVVIRPLGTFDAALPADLGARVDAIEGVEGSTASLLIRSLVDNPEQPRALDSRDGIVFVIGVDLARAPEIKDLSLQSGRLPSDGADEMVIPERLADRLDLVEGSQPIVTTPAGQHAVTITGLLSENGAGLSFQGSVAYTSLAAAHRYDGREATVNTLDVVLSDGVDADAWIDGHREELGTGLSIERADEVAAGFRRFIAGVSTALTLMSAIAVFVGGFLVFLTFSVAVAERTKIYGTLRVLGALPRQVQRVVLTEAALLGLVASLAGVGLGYALAGAAVELTGALFGLDMPAVGVPVGPAITGLIVGTGLSVFAAWLPGRRASRVGPLVAMREGSAGIETRGRLGPWLAILVVAVVIGLLPVPAVLRAVTTVVVLLGAVLCVPFVLGPVARLLGRFTGRLSKGSGNIAIMHLVKERSRSAYTLGLVMVVLAMLIAVAGANGGMSETLDEVIDRQTGGTVQVAAPSTFDPAVVDELAALPDVASVATLRFGHTELITDEQTTGQDVAIIDADSYFAIASFAWSDGNDETADVALARGSAVLLPDAIAQAIGRTRGETVQVRTSEGVRDFEVAGTYASIGPGFGVVAGAVDAPRFGGGRPNAFLVKPDEGVDPEVVRDAIAATLAGRYDAIIDTPRGLRDFAFNQLRGFFSLAYVVLTLAAITGLLGLANTLAVSVLSRTREIGVLRSTGALRRQIRAMVLVESMTLSLVAFALAIPLGALLTAGLTSSQQASLGFSVPFNFPVALIVPLAVLTLLVAAAASTVPARNAGRLEPVAALRFD